MTSKYGVYKDIEYYIRINSNRYHYEHIANSALINTFDNLDTAIEYANNIKLDIDKYVNSIYIDSISIFKIDDDNNIISDNLYTYCYSTEKIENKLDIKIVNY